MLFKSQNASTWTADQYEDLKFTIYKAAFDTNVTGTVTLENVEMGETNGGYTRLVDNPVVTIQPEQVLTLPSGTFTYTVGARLTLSPSGASATVSAFDSTATPNTITINDISGIWSAGFLDASNKAFQGIVSSQANAIFQ